MFVAPDAELDDGLLDVITTSGRSKLGFLRGLPAVFKGEHIARDFQKLVADYVERRYGAGSP